MKAVVTQAFTGDDDPLLAAVLTECNQQSPHLFPDFALEINKEFNVPTEQIGSEVVRDKQGNIFLVTVHE